MLLAPVTAFPHGGVVLEEDICLIKVGFYQAHFTVFQPESRQHEQFCEDLPDIGESIFVLEYLHDGLESLEVDFRIIENTTGNGSFANKEDVDRLDDIELSQFSTSRLLKTPTSSRYCMSLTKRVNLSVLSPPRRQHLKDLHRCFSL